MTSSADRRAELADNLEAVRTRLADACAAAGRPASDVTLVAVTKTHPASDVALLAELGVTDVGENRHPEAGRKRDELGADASGLRWHFVGAVQTNKANQIARYADVVHAVDRSRLVAALARGAEVAERDLGLLVQVNLDGRDETEHADGGRAGAEAADVAALADEIDAAPRLALRGVMAVAPLDSDPAPAFAALASIASDLTLRHPSATWVSAGMSADLEEAVAAGATHVRVGRALLGERLPLR